MKWLFKNWIGKIKPQKHWESQPTSVDQGHSKGSPVYLSPTAAQGHTLFLGKDQTGKTSLMAHLIKGRMQQAERSAIIVIDVDGDLLPTLSAHVPTQRIKDV